MIHHILIEMISLVWFTSGTARPVADAAAGVAGDDGDVRLAGFFGFGNGGAAGIAAL